MTMFENKKIFLVGYAYKLFTNAHKADILSCILTLKGYKLKKIVVICLVLMVFALGIGTALAAPEYDGDVTPNAVMLLDATTGQILFEKNADEVIRPASTTKIMTCIVALENSEMDEVVTVGPEGDWTGSGYSLLGTRYGEEIVMKDLLTGLMMVSGNDAAEAVAVHISGSVDAFARLMNRKASELGMSNTNFVNPHGVDTDDHEVTARDMSKLTLYAMQNEDFMKIVGTETYDMPATNKNKARTIQNTNLLLRTDYEDSYYESAIGIKTGSTPKAYRCVVSAAQVGDTKLLCLIFGDKTKNGVDRWPLAKDMFEFGFENYSTVNVQSIIDNMPETNVQVANSVEDEDILLLSAHNIGDELITLEKSVAQDILNNSGYETTIEFYSGDELVAPIMQGDTVGIVTYRSTINQEIICQAELTATRDVDIMGEVVVEVTQATQKPLEPTMTPQPQDDTEDKSSNFVLGIGWLWLVLGVLLIGVIVFLSISLIKSRR